MSKPLQIAFVKFGGLAAGGTERWLQMMAASLPRDRFEVDYYYCDTAPYVNSDYRHPGTDPDRLAYMKEHNVNLIEFHVGKKDITKPTHDWVDTDFWEKFDASKYDIIQTAKAGPAEYPYYLIDKPVVEFVTLSAGVDDSPNIACSIHLSQWQRAQWFRAGGRLEKSAVIPIPAIPSSEKTQLRQELGISKTAVVAGFHQRAEDSIMSPIPLQAFADVQKSRPSESTDWHFVIMGGGDAYRKQAAKLELKNVHFLPHSGDSKRIAAFLNTLDIFAHGRRDGETFGTVFAEAMAQGKPCLSHRSPVANGQQETMGPAGLFADTEEAYATYLERLYSDVPFREKLAAKAHRHAQRYYSLETCVSQLGTIYEAVIAGKPVVGLSNPDGTLPYGVSDMGFLYAGHIEQPPEIAHHVLTGGIPEPFDAHIVSYFLPKVRVFLDIGANTGLYCFQAAAHCPEGATIHAFEPQQECCRQIEETIYLNNWEDRLTVHPIGLGARKETLKLHLTGSGSSFDNAFNDNADLATVSVPVDTLDHLAQKLHLPPVDFIKIDVEGFEQTVLEGGEETIARDLPVLFIEIADSVKGRSYRNPKYAFTLNWIRKHGYEIWRCEDTGRLVPIPAGAPPYSHLCMYLCLHSDKHEEWIENIPAWARRYVPLRRSRLHSLASLTWKGIRNPKAALTHIRRITGRRSAKRL